MKNRCNNLNDESHAKDYSARGITYCNQWENYEVFQEWALSNGYKDALTLDRIDVNGNYEPNNCRWTTMKIQQRNKRNNRIIEFNGNSKTLAEWSEVTGLSVSCIRGRLIHGWTVQDALTTKSQR